MARGLFKLLLVLASAGLAILLLEAGLWALGWLKPVPRYSVGEGKQRKSDHWVVDPATGWRMRPNPQRPGTGKIEYRSNSQGFRAEQDFDPDDPRFKVVITGDSFTWAYRSTYEESYPALVDARLPGAVVFNLAMPGFGVDQMYLSVREQGLDLAPDLLVVAFCDADFTRSQTAYRQVPEQRRKPAFKLVDGRLTPKTAGDRPNPMLRFLEFNSRVWMGIRYATRAAGYVLPVGEWWTLNKAILDEIQAIGKDRSIPVLFVYIPTAAWRPFPTLNSYMTESGAGYINLRDGKPEAPEGLYIPDDGHFTAAGHRYAADRIAPWIAERFPRTHSDSY